MLIRIGADKGVNTDQLQSWTYVPVPEPDHDPGPAPETGPETEVSAVEPAPVGLSSLRLVFTGSEMVLEGDEADKMQAYLRGKVGSVV